MQNEDEESLNLLSEDVDPKKLQDKTEEFTIVQAEHMESENVLNHDKESLNLQGENDDLKNV